MYKQRIADALRRNAGVVCKRNEDLVFSSKMQRKWRPRGLDEQESAVAQKVATCDEYGGNKSFAKSRHSYEVARNAKIRKSVLQHFPRWR